MAIKNGVLKFELKAQTEFSVVSQNLSGYEANKWPYFNHEMVSTNTGSIKRTTPKQIIHRQASGSVSKSFSDDWYETIHVVPNQLKLGNLLSTQTRKVEVWNAYEQDKTLQSISPEKIDGIDVKQPVALPATYKPLESQLYIYTVDSNGPPTIDELIKFDFNNEKPRLHITGNRVVVFSFAPNWDKPVTYDYEWLTQVHTAYDGTEQRIKIRQHPRTQLEYELYAEHRASQKLDALLWGWQSRVFAVPLWQDGVLIASQINQGDTNFIIPYLNRYLFKQNGLLVLMRSSHDFEVLEIKSIINDRIETKSKIINDWPVGSFIYPVYLARLPKQVSVTRPTDQLSRMTAQFELAEQLPFSANNNSFTHTIYMGHPVITQPPNRVSDLKDSFQRTINRIDFNTGTFALDDKTDKPIIIRNYQWLLQGKQNINDFINFLHFVSGKYSTFWVPTWHSDVEIKSTTAEASENISIHEIGYHQFYRQMAGKRDLMFLKPDKTQIFKRISGSAIGRSGEEFLSLDKPFQESVSKDTFLMISFMGLHRLESDNIEVVYLTDEIAQINVNMRLLNE